MEKAPRYKCHIWRCSQVIISPTWRFYFTSWNKTVLYLLIFYPPFRLMVFLLAHASALYINCLHMNVSVIKTRIKELSTSVKRLSIFTEESLKHSFSLGVLLPLHRQLKFRGAFMHYILCKSPASFLEGTDLRKIKEGSLQHNKLHNTRPENDCYWPHYSTLQCFQASLQTG